MRRVGRKERMDKKKYRREVDRDRDMKRDRNRKR